MATTYTVDCASKNRGGNITELGGPRPRRWKHFADTVHSNIRAGDKYVVRAGGRDVQVGRIDGRYLRTEKDDRMINNLDNLKDCPR